MNPKIDWFEIFFSSSGRVGAVRFTIAASLLLLLLGVYDSTIKGAMAWLSFIVYVPLLFSGACVLSKRLHDRGRSGWWSAVILLAVAMVWPGPEGFLDFVAVLVLVWAVIDLCIMPGERGNNRYGPSLHRLETREQN
jgi:uncharacterized membrane protein YhaH (DUF805 family)